MQTKEQIEDIIIKNTEAEYAIDAGHKDKKIKDFELLMRMYNLVPDTPEEDWMADTPLPEFLTQQRVQSAIEASQEFSRRDFVEVYHESKEEAHMLAGEAKKELINRVLNKRHLHYFQKRMRASGLKNISGSVFYRCRWERKTITNTRNDVRAIPLPEPLPNGQQEILVPISVEEEQVIYDRFNLDVLDPRTVSYSPEYTYSLNDKKRVNIEYETNIREMTDDAKVMAYINLDKVEKALETGVGAGQTNVHQGNDEEDQKPKEYEWTALAQFKAVEVHLWEWVIVGEDGMSVTPGIDGGGRRVEGSRLMKIIKSYVDINGKKILVRYQRYPYRDPFGNPYCNIVMGKCYIHPTDDEGFGDGKAAYPLEKARNGIFNMGVNRVTLATLPTLKANTASAQEFRKTWAFEPNGVMEAYNTEDIQEFKLSDDITGVNNIMAVLTGAQQAATASYPQTQGGLPLASTSATATVATEAHTDSRSFYKGLTYNNTALMEIYDIIGWMYWQFALPETAEKDLGDKIFDFNPYLGHTFKTVTEAFETDSSRQAKTQILDNMFMQSSQIQNKNTLKQLNYIMVKKAKLLGDEYEDIADKLFDEKEEFVPGPQQGSAPAPGNSGATNQTGIPINQLEASARSSGRQR